LLDQARLRKHRILTVFGKKGLYRDLIAWYLPQKLANTCGFGRWDQGLIVDIWARVL